MIDLQPLAFVQVVLTDFLSEGPFGHHIQCMRELYAGSQAALVSASERELTGLLDVPYIYGTQSSASGISVRPLFDVEVSPVACLAVEIGEGVSLGRRRNRDSSSVCL